MTPRLTLTPLPGIGEISPGVDVVRAIVRALDAAAVTLTPTSVVVVAQKIVSKAEGRTVDLDAVVPSARAVELAALTRKDPALVEVVLRESAEVVRAVPNVLIVRHRLGFVVANAGIDQSNVPARAGMRTCLMLPVDPGASARALRDGFGALGLPRPAVVISDSFGRPWRRGVVNVSLGSSGLPALIDRRGEPDRQGRTLKVTEVAFGDALAAAAGLVMGEADEGTPVVHIGGAAWTAAEVGSEALVRPLAEDLFQ